ncbi:hypothetical protein [Edwardsiella hoshinae]|nr:hypothetical protein [Edwardsiella hoshinae]
MKHNSGQSGIIKTRNMRMLRFYTDWLCRNHSVNNSSIPCNDAESCRKALNRLVLQIAPDKNSQAQLLSQMEKDSGGNILPQEAFDWLTCDERATFWLWGYLATSYDHSFGMDEDFRFPNFDYRGNLYEQLGLSLSPSSHQDRLDLIIDFFDRMPANNNYDFKRILMDTFKSTWGVIYNRPKPVKWMPDDAEVVAWVWNAIGKHQHETNNGHSSRIDNIKYHFALCFNPHNHREKQLAVGAALDLWQNDATDKQLFLLKLNKAWNQRKLRQSRIDKKAVNTYLKNKTKQRLDQLAEHHGVRISDLLERLINTHYQQIFPHSD